MNQTTMELVEAFESEIHSINQSDPPISKSKMENIKRAAIKGNRQYKHIVHIVEKFVSRCGPQYKLPALHVIDSIVRQSLHQFGSHRDVYVDRFSKNLAVTFAKTFNECKSSDRPKIVRILNKWHNDRTFSIGTLRPLFSLVSKASANAAPKSSKLVDKLYRPSSSGSANHIESKTQPSAKHHPPMAASAQNGSDLGNCMAGVESGSCHERQQTNNDNEAFIDTINLDEKFTEVEQSKERRSHSINSDNVDYQKLLNDSRESRCLSWTPSPKSEPPSDSKLGSIEKESMHTGIEDGPANDSKKAIEGHNSTFNHNSIQDEQIQKLSCISDRQRRCLPPLKANHLTVCSSTLWVGHLPKAATEADISDVFGMFGTITSIDMISSRGCAYIWMDRRQDASRVIIQSENIRLIKNKIRISWAPGKGFKSHKKLKDFWDAEIGASYIPYNEIDESIDLDLLEEGGVIDGDSMTPEMKHRRTRSRDYMDTAELPVLCPSGIISPALMLLQQQQQQIMNSFDPMSPFSTIPPHQPPPSGMVQNHPVFQAGLNLPMPNQLAHLVRMGNLPGPNLQREMTTFVEQQQHLGSMYQGGPPPHLMLNNSYLQGLTAIQNQTNHLVPGLHMPLPPNHTSAQQQHFMNPNFRNQPPSEYSNAFAPELVRSLMMNPYSETMQYSHTTRR